MNNDNMSNSQLAAYKPTPAYVGISWAAMLIGVLAYLIGLWNAQNMLLNERGYYLAVLALGLYAAISLQKTIRDRSEGIPTTNLYYMISWAALGLSIALIVIGLFNADGLLLSERGFLMMAFTLSLFAAVTIQKNTRDEEQIRKLAESTIALDKESGRGIEHQADDKSQSKSLSGLVKPKRESNE